MNYDFLAEQRNEITNYVFYEKLAKFSKGKNSEIFKMIARKELEHYNLWKKFTKKDIGPNKLLIFFSFILFRIFGLIFAIKFMENKEKRLEERHKLMSRKIPMLKNMVKDEQIHEKKLEMLISEDRINYISSIVLGLNDALVEITASLAGLTLAIPNTKLVGVSGLIMGVAASLSMGAAGYMSVKAENVKSPLKSSIYTGMTYIVAVIFLVLPFFIFKKVFFALTATILFVFLAIAVYNFYVSTVKEISFRRQFLEMAIICVSIAIITFFIGFLVNKFLGVSI